jgi:endothelin-converting enzyme/putative endopeptidase
MMKRLIVTCGLALLVGCAQDAKDKKEPDVRPPTSGIEQANMDRSVRPQDDFFEYVNGTWLKTAEIPADQTSIGGFRDLRENARQDVLVIIQDLATQTDVQAGSDEQKVADLYKAFMDSVRIEHDALAPLQAELASIAALTDKTDLSAYMAHALVIGAGGPFFPYVSIDAKDATRYAVHIWQGGLGLPDRDYYFKDDERSATLRTAYVEHVAAMFGLAGWDDPAGSADLIMKLETRLAGYHRTNVANRDSEKRYNKYAMSELATVAPGPDWNTFIATAGLSDQQDVIVNQPDYLAGFGEVFSATPLSDWQTYLRWRLLNSFAGELSSAFADQNFAFFSRTLNGQETEQPRWKRGVDTVNGTLGEVIGKVYVSKHFKPEAKARMVDLVENLRTAYGEAIAGLEWMSPETRRASLEKLARFTPKVGYPDVWEDYSRLEIRSDDLIGNLMRAREFQWLINREKLGGPIRKYEWGMTPQTVNAYYSPNRNEIVFPAAILQPPFFNMAADDAVNYGAIGAVIGHEMGHGFDDQGSRYDGDGNLRNWWTENDLAEFKKRTGVLVEQFSQYKVFEDLNVNGELTLGENIGDLAGLTIAWRAYQNSLGGQPAPVIDGLSGDQRFFLGFGQVWRYKDKEETARNRVATDPHSPPRFRVLGTLANMPEFYQTFDVKQGDAMYRPTEERVKVW